MELISTARASSTHFLRQLPVDFRLAPQRVIARFVELQPDVTILCGMAEERSRLNLESSAVLGDRVIRTRVDLRELTKGLTLTEISHDAGRFVCNETYFRMLSHIEEKGLENHCVFAHVPPLTDANRAPVLENFREIVRRLSTQWRPEPSEAVLKLLS